MKNNLFISIRQSVHSLFATYKKYSDKPPFRIKNLNILLLLCVLTFACRTHPAFNNLVKVVKDNNMTLLTKMLDQGEDPNTHENRFFGFFEDKHSTSILEFAISKKNDEAIKILLEHGANTQEAGVAGWTPLVELCSMGKYNLVEIALNQGVNTHLHENSLSPIHSAVFSEHLNILKLLVQYGFSVEQKSSKGLTPLMYAARTGNLDIIQYLVDQGVNLNEKDGEGRTALSYAFGRGERTAANYLESAGVIRQETDKQLEIFCVASNFSCNFHEKFNDRLPDFSTRNDIGNTPFILAAKKGNCSFIDFAIENGVDVNETGSSGETALIVSVINYRNDVLKLLLSTKGINLNVINEEKENALNIAIVFHNFEACKLLIEHGIDINNTGWLGWSPLFVAMATDNFSLVTQLLKSGAILDENFLKNKRSILFAVKHKDSKLLSTLIQKGGDLNFVDKKGNTMLHLAVLNHDVRTAKLLLAARVNPDIKNSKGETAIYLAKKQKNMELLNLFSSSE